MVCEICLIFKMFTMKIKGKETKVLGLPPKLKFATTELVLT